ncbi:aa3-type cytochrome c oxidase subunit IV [Sphingomonas sp. JC676]|nr:aa3-type cytochrome c oxidase subunit IV [Sphingomonas sp. JC676]MBC9034331.1 aa3-type cytochrome c oxidase subunit IV [Sphingomonas sp. JC676]
MAEIGDSNVELQAHQQTWHGFTAMMKWGTLGVAIIAAFVVFLIASK